MRLCVLKWLDINLCAMSLFTLHINCEESGFTGKPVMDLVDPSQVDHEGGSGARPEVDHQGLALHRHIQ